MFEPTRDMLRDLREAAQKAYEQMLPLVKECKLIRAGLMAMSDTNGSTVALDAPSYEVIVLHHEVLNLPDDLAAWDIDQLLSVVIKFRMLPEDEQRLILGD